MALTKDTTATTTSRPADVAQSVTELLERACANDPTAWDELVRRYSGVVLAKVRSFGLQDADALDAAQMTWMRLAENCHRVQLPERLSGWLATTASRECLNILRQQSKLTPTPDEVVAGRLADQSVGPEQRIVDADTARLLWSAVATLPPRRRTLLRELFIDQPRNYAEVARRTGIPPGGIGPTRSRALAQLRRTLNERDLAPGA